MIRNKKYPLYEREEFKSLSYMVCRKAEKCKNQVAFQYIQEKEVHSVTWNEFLKDILITGKYLAAFGIRPVHIAILGENSYQWIVTFMAAVMSGNVAVPLDKELGADEIQELLMRSNSQICVYSELYKDVARELNTDVIFLSMDALEKLQQEDKADYGVLNKWLKFETNEMAALFYTSGTSGKNKGVMLSQKNLISGINFTGKSLSLEGSTVAILPFHHAYGLISSVFDPLNCERIVFINSSLKNIKRDMVYAKPKMLVIVPLFIENFHKTIWQTARKRGQENSLRFGILLSNFLLGFGIDIRRSLFRSILDEFGGELEYIVSGGAPLQEKYVQEFRGFGIEILNGYGITECSPVVAVNRNLYHKDGSAGQILTDCKVRLQDGEIQVRGEIVMLGYYQDEAATQMAFEEGWFKTGDLGYMDEDGFLYVTGRKKNLIILSNGENVSPEELEMLLKNHEIIKEAIVYEKNGIITAEIFSDIDTNLEETTKQLQKIIDGCNRKLPRYKRMQKLIVREKEFPKTTSQKIKR